jgi:hypothetical protein
VISEASLLQALSIADVFKVLFYFKPAAIAITQLLHPIFYCLSIKGPVESVEYHIINQLNGQRSID